MRVGYLFLGITLAASAGTFAATAVGCGGSEDSGPTADAGSDATTDTGAKDVVSEPTPDTAQDCPDADLLTYNSPQDAAIDDAGATLGTCLGCIRDPAKCRDLVVQCNASCACKESVVDFATCVGAGKTLFNCALGSGFQSTKLGQDIGACVLTKCSEQCGVPADAGLDAKGD